MPALKINPDGTPHICEFARRKHIHTNKPSEIYACAHPNCFSSMHKKLLKGKESICSICHRTKILLDFNQLKLARPRCLACANTNEAKAVRQNKEILEGLGIL